MFCQMIFFILLYKDIAVIYLEYLEKNMRRKDSVTYNLNYKGPRKICEKRLFAWVVTEESPGGRLLEWLEKHPCMDFW